MYFDNSLAKYTGITLLTVMMTFLVSLTFELKNYFFGSTPFFPAAVIFTNRMMDETSYLLSAGSRNIMAAVTNTGGTRSTVVNSRDARAIPVLTYHRVTQWAGSTSNVGADEPDGVAITLPHFRDQMEALKEDGWQTVTLDEFQGFMDGSRMLPEKSFLLTFDDGAKDSFYPVDPILRELGYTAINYLIVSGMQRKGSTYYLSEEEIKRMLETGRWEIGSHTNDAHHTAPIDAEGSVGRLLANKLWKGEEGRIETTEEFRARLEGEFAGSKNYLGRTFGVPINTFAFPFGDTGSNSLNFPDAESVVLAEAARHYALSFIQKERGQFSYNYTYSYPKSGFVVLRIKVDPQWSGAELLAQLERGMPKDLPYQDPLDEDRGWVPAWGSVSAGAGALALSAQWPATSASTILDGSRVWQNYRVDAKTTWNKGYAYLLLAAQDARTYYSCAYRPGEVRVQQSIDGSLTTLARAENPGIIAAEATLGAIVNGSLTCLYNGRAVASAPLPVPRAGGIGFQAWSATAGEAALTVDSITVTPNH